MAGDINEKYIAQYIAETEQNIEAFNEMLLGFEKDKNNFGCINDLFRIVHTVKGTSGILNVVGVQKVAHRMENILSYVRETKKAPDDAAISLLFAGIDAIAEAIILLKRKKYAQANVEPLCNELDLYFQRLTAPAPAGEIKEHQGDLPPAASGMKETADAFAVRKVPAFPEEVVKAVGGAVEKNIGLFKILVTADEKPPLKSMKVLLVKERLQRHGTVTFMEPEPDTVDDSHEGPFPLVIIFCGSLQEKDVRAVLSLSGITIVSLERIEAERLREKFDAGVFSRKDLCGIIKNNVSQEPQKKRMPMDTETAVAGKPSAELVSIRVDSNKLDNLMNLSGELVIARARVAQLVSVFNGELFRRKELLQAAEGLRAATELLGQKIKDLTVQVKSAPPDAVRKTVKIAEELSVLSADINAQITRSPLSAMVHSLDEVTSALGKISSDIQSAVMQARMIPVEGAFARFKRIIRDLAKERQKEVDLVIEGEETELDKKIVDGLGDPLTHLIRNAIDHGIEDTDTRRKLGKPEIGTISLRASHKGSHIWIEVSDDGRGIDPGELLETALKKKFIDKQQAEKMTEREKINLIFLPGFSTAEKVSDLSGRGVGMDVVKNMVASVNGVIDIATTAGKGTTIVLKIPLTLAIIQALLVRVGESTYAFPLESVDEIVRVPQEEIHSLDGVDTVKLRGHALNLIELEKTIKVKGQPRRGQLSTTMVVITDGEARVGVVIDSLIGEEEIVVKSLSEHFNRVRGVTGASILGDGTIALILDSTAIIKEAW